VVCVECLRAGAQLVEPKLTHAQLLVIAGNCRDEHHTHLPAPPSPAGTAPAVALAPVAERPPLYASRPRSLVRALVVAATIALAGGAAYGMVPGELGHHGAQLVDGPTTYARTPADILRDAYRSLEGTDGGTALDAEHAGVVYVDGDTDSDGTSIVSVALPTRDVSVLATRDLDGSCTFLHGTARGSSIATTPPGSTCHASAAPHDGWSPALQ
jgi:hypothetical protein